MPKAWCLWIGLLAGLPRVAAAQSHKDVEAPADEQQYSCAKGKAPVMISLKPDTEVKDLVTWVMGFTCKNFILDPRIVATGKKVSVIVPNKLSPAEAYQVFLVALSTIGLTVVTRGSVQRIVEAATAKKEVLPIGKQLSGDGDQFVRLVVRPSYAQPEALRQAFTALKSDGGDILVIGSTLVVTDYASALASMLSLKKLIDVPAGTDGVYTIPIHHADATKVAQMLGQMFSAPQGAPSRPAAPGAPGPDPIASGEPVPSKILVDERTSTLVVSASEPAYLRVKALVERLDIPVDLEGAGSIHTYQLSSAIADELAQTLTKAISGDTAAARPQRPGQAPNQPNQPAQPQPASPLDGLGATLQGAVKVNADKSTNKLLITSSARDFMALREVIRELDQPRRQVYIEAMIVEVDVNRGLDFGASAHGIGSSADGNSVGFGGVQLPQLSSINPSSAVAAGGLLGGVFGTSLTGLASLLGNETTGTSLPSFGLLVQALATRSNTNILSTPSIIAVDNEEAKSKIGENVPVISGVIPAVAGSTTSPLTTNVVRQPLELELTIKPHISANDTILMEIKHNAGGIKATTDATLGPTWTTRNVETRVVVRDQQTVLIGGLMQDSETSEESKVPILGDVPLLGYLFKYTKRTKHKTNLLIMLTPYIIKDQTDLQRIQQRKVRENDEFFRSLRSLSTMTFEPAVDYHRKRGVIEEINRAVQDVEDEVRARGELVTSPGMPAGRIEIPVEPTPAPAAQ